MGSLPQASLSGPQITSPKSFNQWLYLLLSGESGLLRTAAHEIFKLRASVGFSHASLEAKLSGARIFGGVVLDGPAVVFL